MQEQALIQSKITEMNLKCTYNKKIQHEEWDKVKDEKKYSCSAVTVFWENKNLLKITKKLFLS